jgi:hypothetical protein
VPLSNACRALRLALILLVPVLTVRAEESLTEVTRANVIATAGRYVRHVWTPAEQNIFHGVDADGIRLDTPDAGFPRPEPPAGWWRVGEKNVGIPYMWGGFDTPESFDAGLRAGKAAGDFYTAEKRRLLDDAVSKHAVGIDCSGLISRCWQLPRSYSTRELTALCEPVTDLTQIRPGDIFNLHNSHVVLFACWEPADAADESRAALFRIPVPEATPVSATTRQERLLFVPGTTKRFRAYEAGGDPMEKVVFNSISLGLLLEQGYSAWRYRGIRE